MLIAFFIVQKLFGVMYVHLFISTFVSLVWGALSKKTIAKVNIKEPNDMFFFLRVLWLQVLYLGIICFEYISVCSMRKSSI